MGFFLLLTFAFGSYLNLYFSLFPSFENLTKLILPVNIFLPPVDAIACTRLEPFLIAAWTNLFPSNLFPFIAKKISFFLISLELIETFLIVIFLEIEDLDCSLIILSFKSLDKNLFFLFI